MMGSTCLRQADQGEGRCPSRSPEYFDPKEEQLRA